MRIDDEPFSLPQAPQRPLPIPLPDWCQHGIAGWVGGADGVGWVRGEVRLPSLVAAPTPSAIAARRHQLWAAATQPTAVSVNGLPQHDPVATTAPTPTPHLKPFLELAAWSAAAHSGMLPVRPPISGDGVGTPDGEPQQDGARPTELPSHPAALPLALLNRGELTAFAVLACRLPPGRYAAEGHLLPAAPQAAGVVLGLVRRLGRWASGLGLGLGLGLPLLWPWTACAPGPPVALEVRDVRHAGDAEGAGRSFYARDRDGWQGLVLAQAPDAALVWYEGAVDEAGLPRGRGVAIGAGGLAVAGEWHCPTGLLPARPRCGSPITWSWPEGTTLLGQAGTAGGPRGVASLHGPGPVGARLLGTWRHGRLRHGAIVWPDGTSYDGAFSRDETLGGQGTLRFADGTTYRGIFRRGTTTATGRTPYVVEGAAQNWTFTVQRTHTFAEPAGRTAAAFEWPCPFDKA